MLRRLSLLIALCFALGSPRAFGQEPFNVAVTPDKLALLLTQLYGPDGLIVDSLTVLPSGDTHSAHFNSRFQSDFTQFNTALASQIVNVPLPSPASGFTYEFDASLGVFARTTQSFGPILAERAETIGGGRFSFGFTFQNFTFDTIEGLDLDSVPAVFTHDGAAPGGKADVVTTVNSINASVNQFTTFLTYGVTDRLDLSIAIPVVSNDMTVVSEATVQRIGTATDPLVHFFRAVDGSLGNRRLFTAFGSSSGLGDITLRLKALVSNGLSLAMDLRAPPATRRISWARGRRACGRFSSGPGEEAPSLPTSTWAINGTERARWPAILPPARPASCPTRPSTPWERTSLSVLASRSRWTFSDSTSSIPPAWPLRSSKRWMAQPLSRH